MSGFDDVVADLIRIESRLGELAFDRLRAAAEDGDQRAEADERRLRRARRAVTKAIRDLGGEPDGAWG